jgi:hypothetical protein
MTEYRIEPETRYVVKRGELGADDEMRWMPIGEYKTEARAKEVCDWMREDDEIETRRLTSHRSLVASHD